MPKVYENKNILDGTYHWKDAGVELRCSGIFYSLKVYLKLLVGMKDSQTF